MHRSRSVLVAILALLSCGIATQAVVAQDDPLPWDSDTTVAVPTIEEVEAQIKPLAEAQEADDLTLEDTTRLQLLRGALVSPVRPRSPGSSAANTTRRKRMHLSSSRRSAPSSPDRRRR